MSAGYGICKLKEGGYYCCTPAIVPEQTGMDRHPVAREGLGGKGMWFVGERKNQSCKVGKRKGGEKKRGTWFCVLLAKWGHARSREGEAGIGAVGKGDRKQQTEE